MQKIIVVDQKKCLGCQSCRLACGLAHSNSRTLAELVSRDEPVWPRLTLEQTAGGIFPLQCRQCTDAPCLAVCPTGALNREGAAGKAGTVNPTATSTGTLTVPSTAASAAKSTDTSTVTLQEAARQPALQPVLYKQSACIGCRACLVVCPFGLIRVAPDERTLLKCDLCAAQADVHKQTQTTDNFVPACVRACPTRALRYLPLKESAETKRRQFALSYAVAFKADFEAISGAEPADPDAE